MNPTHPISPEFLHDLRSGKLQPILDAVRLDDTLLLGLRGSYVSVYYRGGKLLMLQPRALGSYRVGFNHDYDVAGELQARLQRMGSAAVLERAIASPDDSRAVVEVLWELKRLMDMHPKMRSAHEREFQQLIVRENNRTRSANQTHYFITDIEHAHGDARFDMLGVRWLHDERRRGDRLLPVIFEVKYGKDSLDGAAGLVKHLDDLCQRLGDQGFVEGLRVNIAGQFNQLAELGLMEFNRSAAIETFSVSMDRPQVVIVLAGYNPRSSKLRDVLAQLDRFDQPDMPFDLRFFHAVFSGYAMHDCAMLNLTDFRALVESLGAKG